MVSSGIPIAKTTSRAHDMIVEMLIDGLNSANYIIEPLNSKSSDCHRLLHVDQPVEVARKPGE